MDTYEATNMLMSKIKSVDPENASKIMGYILIQDLTDSDLLSLAFGSDTLLHNVIIKARTHLGLSSNTLSTPTSPLPSPLNPISRPGNNNNPFSTQSSSSSSSSPRVGSPFLDFAKTSSPHSWSASGLAGNSNDITSVTSKSSSFLSYDNIRSGSAPLPPCATSNGGNGSGNVSRNSNDLLGEYQYDEYFSFLDDLPSKSEELGDSTVQLGGFGVNNVDTHLHRRRFSDSDACFGTEDGGCGIGYRPCLYFARGFCKNGENCKFVHGCFGGAGDGICEGSGGGGVHIGSPGEREGLYLQQQEDLMRMKAAQQQQRLAYSKYMNFLLQQDTDSQRMGAASMMMGDEFHKYGQFHAERNDFLAMAMEEKANSASRQIYLTFPADSTFKDEDVSNYFSTFGPVQDVRIPYQQKRMFGFVTFVHSDTVKLILSRGNPHFICDSRVLVKPYKEKGKVANKRQQHLQQQLMDRANCSPCSSPSGLDPRELYDLQLGAKLLNNSQEIMLRRKLERQAELQQAIELQGRRLINLHLPDLRGDYIHHHHRSLSAGAPIFTTDTHIDHNPNPSADVDKQNVLEAKGDSSASTVTSTIAVAEQSLQQEQNAASIQPIDANNSKVVDITTEGCKANECCGGVVDDGLPDSPFASHTKSSGSPVDISPCLADVKEGTKFSSPCEISASSSTIWSIDEPCPK